MQQFLVVKFVKKECINWPRDMKIAAKLLSMFPATVEFWDSLGKTQFECLACLLTPRAIDFIKKKLALFRLDLGAKPAYNLESEKVGEDLPATQTAKPLSVMEFIK